MTRVDERVAPVFAGVPPPAPGWCRFCRIDEKSVDGDRIGWHGPDRTCCTQYGCVRQHWAEVDRWKCQQRAKRVKRTPADIHALILSERKEKATRARVAKAARAAAKGNGVMRGKGGSSC